MWPDIHLRATASVAQIDLTRLSSMRESWMRLNVGFVSQIRRHFLHWRAVHPSARQEMFVEAKELLEQRLVGGRAGG